MAEYDYDVLVLGVRDYINKNGFGGAVLGLSGGIDSALTAAIAARALGPDKVLGVAMPEQDSSPESLELAQALASRYGFELVDGELRLGGEPGLGVRLT